MRIRSRSSGSHAVRRERHETAATAAMRELAATCRDPARNIMPVMMQAVDAEVTIGEIGDIFRQAWGDWQTPKLV